MDQLTVDTATLNETAAALRVVAEELVHADARSDEAAASLGHPGLAAAVHDFAHEWNDRREKMVEAIAGLAEATQGIGQGFERLDSDFGAELRKTRA